MQKDAVRGRETSVNCPPWYFPRYLISATQPKALLLTFEDEKLKLREIKKQPENPEHFQTSNPGLSDSITGAVKTV